MSFMVIKIVNMYSCQHCTRVYKIKTYYTRHIATCQILNKTSKELRDDEECMADTPNIRKLYDIILEMNTQIMTLKKKVKHLEKTHLTKQQKISVMDWLKPQAVPKITWEDWLSNLSFSRKYLEKIFEKDIIYSIHLCIKDDFEKMEENNIPMRAFEQKPNSLFLYKSHGWVEINAKDLDNYICRLHQKCMQEFLRWHEDVEREMSAHEFTNLFTENIRKMNNKSTGYISKKIFQKLHDECKINIKSVVNIEVE